MLKTSLKNLKAHLRYAMWKCSQKVSPRAAADLYDINRTYRVDPSRIVRALDSGALDRLKGVQAPAKVTPVLEHGVVEGGDWDLQTVEFEAMDVWRAFKHRFAESGDWSETDFYKRVSATIEGGKSLWGCDTLEKFDRRLERLDALYAEIRDKGYQSQCDIEPESPRSFGEQDEVHVHIGRDGEYIFADGRHRLCIAKLLGLESIPVKVARRHADWVEFRRQILYYASLHHGKVYAPLTHPDLADIPSQHGHERFEMIRPHLDPAGGTALDIGSHWGYFCHMLDEAGYRCTAVERDAETLEMLQKLMRAQQRHFEIVDGSILNYQPPHAYDVVIALNIFHHFIKTREGHDELAKLLGRLQMGRMFFQPHDPNEPQMQGAYQNYPPERFAEFVAQCGRFDDISRLGSASDGREVFLLAKSGGAA